MSKLKNLGIRYGAFAFSGERLLEADDHLAESAISGMAAPLAEKFGEATAQAVVVESLAAAGAAPFSKLARQGARDIRKAGCPSAARLAEAFSKCFVSVSPGEILVPADLDLVLPSPFEAYSKGSTNNRGQIIRPRFPIDLAYELDHSQAAECIARMQLIRASLLQHLKEEAPTKPTPKPATA